MDERKNFSVSGLNAYVSSLIEADPFLNDLHVEGEISGFKRHSSGHLYFSLKDDGALVRCVMFRQMAMHLRFQPFDGQKVVISGYASLFQRDGSFQLYVRSIEKQGEGDLYRRFIELKARLEQAGYFDAARKKPIPSMPSCVGIVTSGTGAALQDILNVIGRRFPNMNLCICPVKVQGEGAAQEIASAIRLLNEKQIADVMIVGRGGGSIEDLWAFNEPVVASAIYDSKIPIISAVGHETDFTIADFVSDLRAPTPSAAAELAVPELSACTERIRSLKNRTRQALVHDLEKRYNAVRLRRLSSGFQTCARTLDERRSTVDALREQLHLLAENALRDERHALGVLSGKLAALGPKQVLKRGYAYFTDSNKKPVASVDAMTVHDRLTAHFQDGVAVTEVVSICKQKE